METLFYDNIYIILFCFLLGMEGSFEGAENKKIAIFYLFIGALSVTHIVRTYIVLVLLCTGSFILCEVLTSDTHKAKLLNGVLSKILDAFFISVLCHHVIPITLAVVINSNAFITWTETLLEQHGLPTNCCLSILRVVAAIIFLHGVNRTLSDNFQPANCQTFLKPFCSDYLFTAFDLTPELDERLEIIAKIEDKHYWKRKSYISLSFSHFLAVIKERKQVPSSKKKNFIKQIVLIIDNIRTGKRGYSTIQMQLTRILGLNAGYRYVFRRKIFEFVYARLYFHNLKNYINYRDKDDTRFKKYLLNVYAHHARCFRTIHSFEPNMLKLYHAENNERLENLSLEQIFVASCSLSNKLSMIDEGTIGLLLDHYQLENLDRNEILRICDQVKSETHNMAKQKEPLPL